MRPGLRVPGLRVLGLRPRLQMLGPRPTERRQPGPNLRNFCGDASEAGVEVGQDALHIGLLRVHPWIISRAAAGVYRYAAA